MDQINHWNRRTLEHIQMLSKGIGARAATSEQEKQAADYVHDVLKRLGVSQVQLESFRGAASEWLPWSIAFSLAAWSALVGLLLGIIGAIVASGLNLLAAWIVYRTLTPPAGMRGDSLSNANPVRRWIFQGDSHNVVGVVSSTATAKRKIVLLSYLDSAKTPFLWRNQRRRHWSRYLAPILFLSLLASAVTLPLGALTDQAVFLVIALLMLLLQTAALVATIRAEHSPTSPGANNNASGVGTLLALAERLKETPLTHTEVWLLTTGCRETGGDGVRAFLDAHAAELTDTAFIALEGVGTGEQVVYLTGEGVLRHTPFSPEILALAATAAEHCRESGIPVIAQRQVGSPTEAGIIARSGLKGTAINIWPDGNAGVLGRRRIDDAIETIQKEALAKAHTFAWSLLQEIDTQ